MESENRTLDEIELWSHHVAVWVRVVVVLASVITVAIAAVGARAVWMIDRSRDDTYLFCNDLPYVLALLLIASTDGEHPFRAMSVPVPGPAGLAVMPASERPGGFTDTTLALWRPCIAYVIILTAVALPALASALEVY